MYTVAGYHELETHIKKSRFVTRVLYVSSEAEAMSFLEEVRDPAASHNCWAFRTGDIFRFSDEGEPTGTAGKPILGSIFNKEFDNVMVVVTRYFGGIKLGAGGLIRAYGGVTAQCLDECESHELVEMAVLTVKVPFELTGNAYRIIEKNDLEKVDERYLPEGLEIEIHLPRAKRNTVENQFREQGGGKYTLTVKNK